MMRVLTWLRRVLGTSLEDWLLLALLVFALALAVWGVRSCAG